MHIMWTCPACHLPLTLNNRSWHCQNHHSYDMAKEGYVNLLLAQHKNSKTPGDSKEMIAARREFLQMGCYQPLMDAIADALSRHAHQPIKNLFDAGCGEGHYLHQVIESYRNRSEHPAPMGMGVDISKPGVQKAAKRYSLLQFAVASTFSIPLPDDGVDAAIQVFAPSSDEQMRRVIQSSGLWVLVNPAPNHLHQLKRALYDDVNEHQLDEGLPEGFVQLERINVTYDMSLNDRLSRMALLKMTPFYWHSEATKHALFANQIGNVTADFDMRILRRL